MNNKLKVFVSYCHKDQKFFDEFHTHFDPIREKEDIILWSDKHLICGDELQSKIDKNLYKSDIVLLFISQNFLASAACKKEMEQSLEMKKRENIFVVPIILTTCSWSEFPELRKIVALPTDGKAVESFSQPNIGYLDICKNLKKRIQYVKKIKNVKVSDKMQMILNDMELITNAHFEKEKVVLDDIFIYPELLKINNGLEEYNETISSEMIIDELLLNERILIQGDNQSGKTVLCKKIFKELRKKNYFPILISDKENQFKGDLNKLVINNFLEQYQNITYDEIDENMFVIIIDDFHYAKHKEKLIKNLSSFKYQIFTVDDLFNLSIDNENISESYNLFKLKELKPSLQNTLVNKRIYLTDKKINSNNNDYYKSLDDKIELIESVLGKVFGNGIMPSYPFFILSIINLHDIQKPLDQEITSQGYCYQTLIYLSLKKHGVKSDEIDIYLNFLSEFSYYLFSKKKIELTEHELEDFFELYIVRFNFPLEQKILLEKLQNTNILRKDNFNNFSFLYNYVFYFFVAKNIAENIHKNKNIVEDLCSNLHVNENAYIVIFMSHHSKNIGLLDEVIGNSKKYFSNYNPSTLKKNETLFFDNEIKSIIDAVIDTGNNPEKTRNERLLKKDEQQKFKSNNNNDNDENDLGKALRRSIKTIEVIGNIIKNRSGSIERNKLEEIFLEGINLCFRIISSFFEIIKDTEQQSSIIDFITSRIHNTLLEKGENKNTRDEIEKIVRGIFWNVNFSIVYGFIDQAIRLLGSDKLMPIIKNVCENVNTPASEIIKYGILMRYSKSLNIESIKKSLDSLDFSETATKIMKYKIVEHCSMHHINYKEQQKVASEFEIPLKNLSINKFKNKNNSE